MEFLYSNYINTSTMITVSSGTATAEYLIDRDYNIGWSSVNFDDDATSCTLRIDFAATTAVDRLILLNHNLKGFRAFYNGLTATTFTPDIIKTVNSATCSYFAFTSVNCTSVSIQMDSTIIANSEKSIGEIIISEQGIAFERAPNASNYRPKIDRKSIDHKMADGGIVTHVISDKFTCKLSYDFITASFYDDLKSFYDLMDSFIFVAFPTSSSWDAVCYAVNWIGDFRIKEYSSENTEAGFSIDINLAEIAS